MSLSQPQIEALPEAGDLLTIEELAIELRLAKVTINKHIGKWDKEQGVVRKGSRYTRIRRSIFMPLWFAGEIPW